MDELRSALLLLIRAGVALRVVYCFARVLTGNDESAAFKKRAFHAIVFLILAESIHALSQVLTRYFF